MEEAKRVKVKHEDRIFTDMEKGLAFQRANDMSKGTVAAEIRVGKRIVEL